MTLYDSTRSTWESIWQAASVEAELEAIESKRSQEAVNIYLPYLPQDGLILEAGSGLSAVVVYLRERGYNVVGLDYAHNALQTSREYDSTLPLLTGDVHDLPFNDGALTGYLSFGVLEHFEHGMGPALREANRVLKPGGVLVLTIPYPNIVYRLVQAKRQLTGQGKLTDERFYESAYNRAALVREVERANFRVLLAKPTSHAFTLWGLGGIFRGDGYYETTPLAESLGKALKVHVPWLFNFMTLVVARKR